MSEPEQQEEVLSEDELTDFLQKLGAAIQRQGGLPRKDYAILVVNEMKEKPDEESVYDQVAGSFLFAIGNDSALTKLFQWWME